MMRLRAVVALAAVLGGALAACGEGETPLAAPQPVAEGLVPRTVLDASLGFHESELAVHETFAEAGPNSLASDGQLWELRRGDRLIGVLQLTTLLPEIDLAEAEHRDAIVNQLLPTARDRFDVGDVTVWSTAASGKTSYLWFAQDMFALLTIKPGTGDDIEPEAVLEGVLDHMVAADTWEYLYVNDDPDAEREL